MAIGRGGPHYIAGLLWNYYSQGREGMYIAGEEGSMAIARGFYLLPVHAEGCYYRSFFAAGFLIKRVCILREGYYLLPGGWWVGNSSSCMQGALSYIIPLLF